MPTKLTHLFVISVAALTTLATLTSDAFADRRSSLAGNLLISDQDDVFLYPQLSLEHRNLVSLDYYPGNALNNVLGVGAPNALGPYPEETAGMLGGPNAMGGSGLLLFGQDGFAFGIATHREEWYGSSPGGFLGAGDLQLYGAHRQQAWGFLGYNSPVPGASLRPDATPTPNGGASTASGPGVFLQPLQMVDVMLGIGTGESSSFGLRLSAGQNLFRERRNGPQVNDTETWNATVVNLLAGFSLRGDLNLDLGAEFGLAFFSNVYTTTQNEPDYRDNGALAPSFSLTARGDTELAEHIKLGFLGIIHVNAASHRDQFGGTGVTADSQRFNSSNVFVEGGAGPVYELPDRTTIAAYGTVGFGSSSHKDELRDYNTSGLLLPGFKLAFEHWVAQWFAFRTGLSSRYYFTFGSRTYDDDTTPNVAATSTYHEFLWSVGVGFAAGNFELAGTFQTPFVTSGPAFIGGEANGMFGLLNASYKF